MSKKNLLSGRDKELQEMAEQYEAAKAENRTIYLDADDLADLADWYAVHHKYAMATEVVEYGLGIHPDNTALLNRHTCSSTPSIKSKPKIYWNGLPKNLPK